MTSPLGSLSLAQSYLRIALADCAAFREWAGAQNQAGALERIYYEGLPAPANDAPVHTLAELQGYRPYAVVYTAEEAGFTAVMEAVGDHAEFSAAGRLKLRLYQEAPAACGDEPTSDANLQFKNAIGRIIDDLCELAGKPGYLAFHQVRVDAGPFWGHPKVAPTQGVWQGVELGIDWRGI